MAYYHGITRRSYNDNNDMISETDTLGNVRMMSYDRNGNRLTMCRVVIQ